VKLQTSISYEALAQRLGLDPDLKIDLVEVDRVSGTLVIVVDGKVPTGTVTGAGFYPSPKRRGADPDSVHINYLTRRDPS